MKNILYLHGYGSNKDSYTGNLLKELFPEHHWVLETFDLVHVQDCVNFVRKIVKDEQIDIVISSSLGSVYNLFIKKDRETNRMVDKIFINPCCVPSEAIPQIAPVPQELVTNFRALEYNIYNIHQDNSPDKVFGIFAKHDELLQYHDFFAGRYGNWGEGGLVSATNCIWVEGGHSHLERDVLRDAVGQALAYFDHEPAQKRAMASSDSKEILYVDMDGTLVDWDSGVSKLSALERLQYDGYEDEIPNVFSRMDPMPGAVTAFEQLSRKYDIYILSTSPWRNESAPSDKLRWVQHYFGKGPGTPAYKRLILSHHKELQKKGILIDDRPGSNGAQSFEGMVIPFGVEPYETWDKVVDFLMKR